MELPHANIHNAFTLTFVSNVIPAIIIFVINTSKQISVHYMNHLCIKCFKAYRQFMIFLTMAFKEMVISAVQNHFVRINDNQCAKY